MNISDKIFPGVIIGILADAVKLLVNYILYFLGFADVVFWQVTASRFLDKKYLFMPTAYFIGAVADITVTAGLGVVFVFLIYYIGSKHLYLKGIGYGLVIWVVIFGTLLGQSVQEKLPQNPSGIVVTIVAHLFFGLALAFFYRRSSEFIRH